MEFKRHPFKKTLILHSLIVIMLFWILPQTVTGEEKTFRNSSGMEFVKVSAGTFIMGSPPDEASRSKGEVQHQVTISRPFYMQTTEVTLKQWWAVMGKKFFGARKGKDNMPVTDVSWIDCTRFIKKLNKKDEGTYRLPYEAEWEYACRAGTTTVFSWGNTIDCSKAMYANKSLGLNECMEYYQSKGLPVNGPAPVKSFPPNAWGIHDMHGNVWEWCQDWFNPYPLTPVTDPTGSETGTKRIRRGGSWFKYGYSCRSANRNYGNPATRFQTTGFRVVREID
jgi:formylglycine-generating enzyme required for sulfatase activity